MNRILQVIILIAMTATASVASLSLKRASGSHGFSKMIKNKNLYLGGGLYILVALLNIYLIRFIDYSVFLPLTSMTYIWTMLLSRYVLHEKITLRKIFGICLIISGVVVLTV